jgi:formate dehydrogenase accessory protein FdhE
MLRLYGALLTQQETVHAWAPQLAGYAHSPDDDDIGMSALLVSIPASALGRSFSEFVSALKPACTATLRTSAETILAVPQAIQAELLRGAAAGHGVEANVIDCEPEPLEFFLRAFLQPIAEARRQQLASDHRPPSPRVCPRCREAPVIGVLRDDGEVKGRRYLVCSLCNEWWSFPRLQCPNCGETDAQKLEHHVPEEMSHLRVEECASCATYIKTVDLRVDGRSEPVVDDIATVELDLWSVERGLRKIQRNIVGV